jgi:ATP-dependent Clp protease adaptor protein ClpS
MKEQFDTPPDFQEAIEDLVNEVTNLVPQYNVVLIDDNDHTYDYVIEMLMKLFGHNAATAYNMACTVDATGRVVVDTTHKERAEVKRDQIHSFGADWRLDRSVGSMSAEIEPE